jgi:3-methyladenine DNA glycosylase AlkD
MKLVEEIIAELKSHSDPVNVEGMARFGINSNNTLGVKIPIIREMAKKYKKQHTLAIELWKSAIHEARILASIVDDPKLLSSEQMENWVADFDSWDVCDQVVMNLFEKRLDLAYTKAFEWIEREEEFVRRAGFVLVARLSQCDRKSGDEKFIQFFPAIFSKSVDSRNFVKKAINWAVRQIGKRNMNLRLDSLKLCEDLLLLPYSSSKWIAKDALKELTNEKTIAQIQKKMKS